MTFKRCVLPFPSGVFVSAAVAFALVLTLSSPAEAKRLGPTQGQCRACHDSGKSTLVTVTAASMAPAISSITKLTVSVTMAAGDTVGGMFISIEGDGMLRMVAGQGTRFEGSAITHAMPKAAVGGKATFDVEYVAPNKQGRVDISVGGISANNNEKEHDDSSGQAFLSLAIGCGMGTIYYLDDDADGFGDEMGRFTRACAKPAGYSDKIGDCNDANLEVSPTAKETCNQRDDDCNGQTDEGLPEVTLFKDGDGDGYGKSGTEMMMGCGARFGWGVGDGDCNDLNRDVHPRAMELCNNIDDNCSGGVDEGALPVCGVGFCRRYGVSCDRPDDCRPGKPSVEKCDLQDNDCDGETDEGATDCKANEVCENATCVPDTGAKGGGSGEGGGSGSGTAGQSGGGGSRRSSGGGCVFAAHTGPSCAGLLWVLVVGSVGLFFRTKNGRRRSHRGA
ncbi:MAG: putative metal-binding motif-containing protein [Deltaproteobacteria bacterium]|nr:putative metal-binding motif-containing protein [Deltaproteobacteria bacterium]